MAIGYLYILSNSAMGQLLKIGFTCAGVEKRAKELSGATGVPGSFVVEYFHLSDDIEETERLVHLELDRLRYNGNREFFDISIDDAIDVIQRLVKHPAVTFQKESEGKVDSRLPCRRCGFLYDRSAQQFCPKCEF